jgi:predicted AlkP superfamily phosphohydrolase/phosphomutase
MADSLVIGLDGASWRLLDPWLEDGTLPNIARLRDSSSWAETESCLPPVTFPNWKCYSAGKNPGEFGVYWFEQVNLADGEISVTNGGDFQTAELWDYLNDEGKRAGVVNMPTMYPPREIDGPIVCGGPDAVESEYRSISDGYATPKELITELEDRFDYRVHPDPLLSSNEERGKEVDEVLDLLETRLEVAVTLLEEKDLSFVHVTLFYLNVLQHFFWNDEPTQKAWELVDKWVGRLHEREDLNLVLMSDHGCAPTTTEFYINEWLADEGYQTRKATVDKTLASIGLDRENILSIAKRVGAVDFLARIVPENIQQLVPQRAGLKRDRKLEAINLPETQAVASGQGPIYLNPLFDTERVREKLIINLKGIEDEYGPIFNDVYRGEDVYSGPYTTKAPEIILDQRPGVHVNDGIGGGRITAEPDRWQAENTRNGIFVANGPDFKSCGELENVDIIDLAPTLLVSHNCDVPRDMDGDVLPIIAANHDWTERKPISLINENTQDASDEVEDRLTQLGYME